MRRTHENHVSLTCLNPLVPAGAATLFLWRMQRCKLVHGDLSEYNMLGAKKIRHLMSTIIHLRRRLTVVVFNGLLHAAESKLLLCSVCLYLKEILPQFSICERKSAMGPCVHTSCLSTPPSKIIGLLDSYAYFLRERPVNLLQAGHSNCNFMRFSGSGFRANVRTSKAIPHSLEIKHPCKALFSGGLSSKFSAIGKLHRLRLFTGQVCGKIWKNDFFLPVILLLAGSNPLIAAAPHPPDPILDVSQPGNGRIVPGLK